MSWDNGRWESGRSDIKFIYESGVERVGAEAFAHVVTDMVRSSLAALGGPQGVVDSGEPLFKVERPSCDWLLPSVTREAVENAGLYDRVFQGCKNGILAHHNMATMLLRSVRLPTSEQVAQVLDLLDGPLRRWDSTVDDIRAPSRPPRDRPWREGYVQALEVRERLKLGAGRVEADDVATRLGIAIVDRRLPSHVSAGLVARQQEAGLVLNSALHTQSEIWNRSMMLATGLGHLVMDNFQNYYAYLHSPTSDWPTGARAKAFGAMFLMPEDGVRAALGGRVGRDVDVTAVGDVMKCFGTGFKSAAWHIRNLGVISESEHLALLAAPTTARAT